MVAQSHSILISDDDRAFRETLCDLLSEQGYAVRGVGDGLEALDVIEHRPIDLILTDFRMPRLSGLELIQRARQVRPHVPAILLSGEVSPQLERAAAVIAVERVLSKPPNPRELTHLVRLALSAQRAR